MKLFIAIFFCTNPQALVPAELPVLGVFCLFLAGPLDGIDYHLKEAEEGSVVHRAGAAN